MTQRQTALVGLTGRKGAGKDTVAEVLLKEGYANVKFAGALKDMIRALLAYQGVDAGTIERMVEGDLKEVATPYLAGQTPRHAMQTLGTEWGREIIAPDLWVQTALNRAASVPKAVITDVRFPNECAAVQERGGRVIRVSPVGEEGSGDLHESEAHIDHLPVDAEFRNDKALGVEIARQQFTGFLAKCEAHWEGDGA